MMESDAVRVPLAPGSQGSAPEPATQSQPVGADPSRGVRPEGFTDEYRETVCKMGQGAECCRYLTCGARGFECAKHTSFAWQIDRKEDMRARGDNCDGVYNLRPAYRLLRDRFEHKAGATIYTAKGHDYGCARDDEYATGKPHTSMTLEPSGDYPFFTVPNEDFEPIGAKP